MISVRKINSCTLSFVLFSCVALLGCSQQNFALQGESLNFASSAKYTTQVDVLFVVDTTGSMQPHQNLLVSQAANFTTALINSHLDFHLGVISMDMSAGGQHGKFGAAPGNPLYFVNDSPAIGMQLGQTFLSFPLGSPMNRGFESVQAAFTEPNLSGYNAGFLRTNGLLNLVFVADEDDKSASGDYTAFLDALKPPLPSGERSWLAHYMGVLPTDPYCQTTTWHYNEIGYKYMAAADQSGGSSSSICSGDLTTAMKNVQQRILEVVTEYKLASVPNVSTIQVVINGKSIPQDATNGWTYYAGGPSLRFHGTSVPAPGTSVTVNYTPAGIQ